MNAVIVSLWAMNSIGLDVLSEKEAPAFVKTILALLISVSLFFAMMPTRIPRVTRSRRQQEHHTYNPRP